LEEIKNNFPDFDFAYDALLKLKELYGFWNQKINLISKKDIDFLYERHVLHSLSIAKIISFQPNGSVLDVGTGGGFPGIPLALFFPKTQFYLIDSIGKKTKVVKEICQYLQLENVIVSQIRAEEFTPKVDFVISRAVSSFSNLVKWTSENISSNHFHTIKNGIFALKGGNLEEEIKNIKDIQQYDICNFFKNPFFKTKKIIYLPFLKDE